MGGERTVGRGGAPDRAGLRRSVIGLLRRPDAWGAAVRVGLRLAEPGWWHRWPPRPVPPAAYSAFRLHTLAGDGGPDALGPDELADYVVWCRRMDRIGG